MTPPSTKTICGFKFYLLDSMTESKPYLSSSFCLGVSGHEQYSSVQITPKGSTIRSKADYRIDMNPPSILPFSRNRFIYIELPDELVKSREKC